MVWLEHPSLPPAQQAACAELFLPGLSLWHLSAGDDCKAPQCWSVRSTDSYHHFWHTSRARLGWANR